MRCFGSKPSKKGCDGFWQKRLSHSFAKHSHGINSFFGFPGPVYPDLKGPTTFQFVSKHTKNMKKHHGNRMKSMGFIGSGCWRLIPTHPLSFGVAAATHEGFSVGDTKPLYGPRFQLGPLMKNHQAAMTLQWTPALT